MTINEEGRGRGDQGHAARLGLRRSERRRQATGLARCERDRRLSGSRPLPVKRRRVLPRYQPAVDDQQQSECQWSHLGG